MSALGQEEAIISKAARLRAVVAAEFNQPRFLGRNNIRRQKTHLSLARRVVQPLHVFS